MNNFLIKGVFAMMVVLGLSSCEDFLNPELKDAIDPSSAFQTIGDAEKVLFGCYDNMRTGQIIESNALLSDNVRVGKGNRGQGVQKYSYTYTPSQNFGWRARYTAIYSANDLIFNIESVSDGTEKQKNQFLGEAIAIRAIAHLDLVRLFGYRYGTGLGVPYRSTPNSPEVEPVRNTVTDVYAQIIADLERAETLITDEKLAKDISRINKNVIKAMIARTKLEMGDYQGALSAANDVIGSGTAPALSTGQDYVDMFKIDKDGEVLWKLINTSAIGQIFYEATTQDNFFAPTDDFVALFEDSDIRKGVTVSDLAGENTMVKYPGTTGAGGNDFGRNTYKMIRMSEVYLIRAEAAYRLNGGGLDDLNAIRTARGATVGSESGSALEAAIITERRKELAFEGHRWYTLKRLGLDLKRGSDCNSSACTVAADNNRWRLPIPLLETNANANMEQNAGY